MIRILEGRFAACTADNPSVRYFSEPGKYEGHFGIRRPPLERVYSKEPIITFNHTSGLGSRRRVNTTDTVVKDLPPWGDAKELWRRFWK